MIRPRILLGTAVASFAAGFAALAEIRHLAFWSGRFDLGNLTQAVWSTAHGRFLEITDLQGRRKAAEAEAAAIRAMMSAPKKVLVAHKPEPPKPVDAAAGIKGTIHKAKAVPGAPAAPGAKPGT